MTATWVSSFYLCENQGKEHVMMLSYCMTFQLEIYWISLQIILAVEQRYIQSCLVFSTFQSDYSENTDHTLRYGHDMALICPDCL